MTVDELVSELGLDAETASIVKAKVAADKVQALKAKKEYDAIQTQMQALQDELVGDGKKGARNYKQWYEENFPKIQKLQGDYAKYVERYGAIDPNVQPTTTQPTTVQPGAKLEDVQKFIQETYTPQWSSLLKGSGRILEMHLRAGRKNDIDWDKLSELAANHNGDLVAAYKDWDAPEAEKLAKANTEAEIERRVQERLKKSQSNSFFPSTEQTPSGISPLSKDRGDAPKYDRSKVIESAVTGLYEPATVS